MDWGRNAPGCVLWWVCLLDGHYHIVHEFKFQGMDAEPVATEITKRNKALGFKRLRYVACDPSMKAKTGHGRGESIMETLQRKGLPMRKGDNDRRNGWARVHELLSLAPDGIPWLTVEPTCKYLIRSMASAISDPKDPEDVDTRTDDHALDALRYGAMSRPSPTSRAIQNTIQAGTLGAMLRDVVGRSSRALRVGASMVR